MSENLEELRNDLEQAGFVFDEDDNDASFSVYIHFTGKYEVRYVIPAEDKKLDSISVHFHDVVKDNGRNFAKMTPDSFEKWLAHILKYYGAEVF